MTPALESRGHQLINPCEESSMRDFEKAAFTPAPAGMWFVRLEYVGTPTNWVEVRPVVGWLTLRYSNGMAIIEAAWMDESGTVCCDTSDPVGNRLIPLVFCAPLNAEDIALLTASAANDREVHMRDNRQLEALGGRQ